MKKKKIIILKSIPILLVVTFFSIPAYIDFSSRKFIYRNSSDIPGSYTALVLGAKVHRSGSPSGILEDRLLTVLRLYEKGKVKKILLSGDHGNNDYDEVNNMKKYLISNGVKTADIFLDHAGFNTYNSIVRAKKIFLISDVTIVTQEFHLPRAIYIANKIGLKARGLVADKRRYGKIGYFKIREYFARIKSFCEVLFNLDPKFLGPRIPITGDSKLSWD